MSLVKAEPFYYCFLKEGKIIELKTKIRALKPYVKGYAKRTYQGRTYTTTYGNIYKLFDYELLNGRGLREPIRFGDFSLVFMYDTIRHTFSDYTAYRIRDKKGMVLEFDIPNWCNYYSDEEINFVASSLDVFKVLIEYINSHFSNWAEFIKNAQLVTDKIEKELSRSLPSIHSQAINHIIFMLKDLEQNIDRHSVKTDFVFR